MRWSNKIKSDLLGSVGWRFGRYNGNRKPTVGVLVLGLVGLAKCSPLPNFGRQGEKGGDFSAQRFEKYDLALAWRKAHSGEQGLFILKENWRWPDQFFLF